RYRYDSDLDRYDSDRRGRDRYDSDRRGRAPRVDDRRVAIVPEEPKEKKGVLARLLEKILEGIKKGLAQRAANEQARNMALRAAVMAGGNPANYGYADWRLRNGIANSNLGARVGIAQPGAMQPVLTAGPGGALTYARVPVARPSTAVRPYGAPGTPYVAPTTVPAPLLPTAAPVGPNLGAPVVTGPAVNSGYTVPVVPVGGVNRPLGR
ncbi:MAG: hypothetical protein D6731_17650, partial [Planctomycetota bacterium]